MKLQWLKYGSRSGWAHAGRVPADALPGDDFWSRTVRVTCAAEGGKVDSVQCYDLGIMSAGPIQMTARYGFLQTFLLRCLQERPADFLHFCQKPMMQRYDGQVYYLRELKPSSTPLLCNLRDRPAGHYAAFGLDDDVLNSPERLTAVYLGGSDQRVWTQDQERLARHWTEALVGLLQTPAFLSIIADEQRIVCSRFLTPAAYSVCNDDVAPQRSAACYTAFAINSPRGARELLAVAQKDAEALGGGSLARRMLAAARRGNRVYSALPSTFASRSPRTARALDEEFPRGTGPLPGLVPARPI